MAGLIGPPEVEWSSMPDAPGRAKPYIAATRDAPASLDEWHSRVDDLTHRELGGSATSVTPWSIVVSACAAHGKASEHSRSSSPSPTSVQYRDGKIVRRSCVSRPDAEALEAVGLSEQDAHADS